jgi:hypothetical protein
LTATATIPTAKGFFGLLHEAQQDGIMTELLRLCQMRPQPDIRFLNYYKEVPVCGAATMLEVRDETLVCRTGELQARAINLSRHTIIKASPLKHDVYAEAAYDADAGLVILSGFSYAEVFSDRRASVRVRMHVPLSVVIEAGADAIKGRLQDISLTGCAIDITDKAQLGKFSFFYLNLATPSLRNGTAARIMIRLVNAAPNGAVCRCVFVFEHDKRSEDQIGSLIAQRQAEIIRELT